MVVLQTSLVTAGSAIRHLRVLPFSFSTYLLLLEEFLPSIFGNDLKRCCRSSLNLLCICKSTTLQQIFFCVGKGAKSREYVGFGSIVTM